MKKVLAILITMMVLMTGCGMEEKRQEMIEKNAEFDIECVLIDKTVYGEGRFGHTTREGILESETGERFLIGTMDSEFLKTAIIGDKFIFNTKTKEVNRIE